MRQAHLRCSVLPVVCTRATTLGGHPTSNVPKLFLTKLCCPDNLRYRSNAGASQACRRASFPYSSAIAQVPRLHPLTAMTSSPRQAHSLIPRYTSQGKRSAAAHTSRVESLPTRLALVGRSIYVRRSYSPGNRSSPVSRGYTAWRLSGVGGDDSLECGQGRRYSANHDNHEQSW